MKNLDNLAFKRPLTVKVILTAMPIGTYYTCIQMYILFINL